MVCRPRKIRSRRRSTSSHPRDDAATAAIAASEASLTRVQGNLRALLAAANVRRVAAERAEEERLAAQAAAAQTQALIPPPPSAPSSSDPPSATPPPSSPPSSPGSYSNPLRDISGLSPERIDEGVDYSGFGPIYAIGDGVVVNTVGDGWPGGTFIAYRLTDGPASGLVVYAAEDIEPSVQVGETVNSGTVIGQVFEGPDGIETGWADGSALPDTMARAYGQFDGSNSSAFGYNFSDLLARLGAPPGIGNGPPSGELPLVLADLVMTARWRSTSSNEQPQPSQSWAVMPPSTMNSEPVE